MHAGEDPNAVTTRNIFVQLKEIANKSFELGVQLGIDVCDLRKLTSNADYDRQLINIADYWINNCRECSWRKLADAVKGLGGQKLLEERLRNLEAKVKHHNSLCTEMAHFSKLRISKISHAV